MGLNPVGNTIDVHGELVEVVVCTDCGSRYVMPHEKCKCGEAKNGNAN